MKKQETYILLKFGRIKFADFSKSKKAMKMNEALNMEDKADIIKVIKAFNGQFKEWWGDKILTKDQAIQYIKNY